VKRSNAKGIFAAEQYLTGTEQNSSIPTVLEQKPKRRRPEKAGMVRTTLLLKSETIDKLKAEPFRRDPSKISAPIGYLIDEIVAKVIPGTQGKAPKSVREMGTK
jgi:hypothetical protein